MAQQEYIMWSPHDKAKLFRRFTGDVPVELENQKVVTVSILGKQPVDVFQAGIINIEDNRYAYAGIFKWVETTSLENSDDQPQPGLILENGYITVRTNSLMTFKKGDLIMLPKSCKFCGLYIIGDGVRIDYAYTPKQVQTYQYLPLSKTT